MKLKTLLLTAAFLAPTLTLAADECLNLETVFGEIAKSLEAGGKYTQGLSDVVILEGNERVNGEWLAQHGDQLLSYHKTSEEQFKKVKIKQEGCKVVKQLAEADGDTLDLFIDKFSLTELTLKVDGYAIVELFAKALENPPIKAAPAPKTAKPARVYGSLGEGLANVMKEMIQEMIEGVAKEFVQSPEVRNKIAEAVRANKDLMAKQFAENFRWTVRMDKEGEFTSTFYQGIDDHELGRVVGETTVVSRWGKSPEEVKPSAKAEELVKAYEAAVAEAKQADLPQKVENK